MLNMTVMFKDWLSTGRKEKGLTLEVLGRRVGTSKGYISGILSEKVNPPSRKMCAKMAKVFQVPEEYVTFMAYRDKAPLPVRNRLGYLEALRGSVAQFKEASSKNGNHANVQAAWQEIIRLLAVLDKMWPSEGPTNGH